MVLSEAPIPLSPSSISAANTVLTSKGTLHFMQILEETCSVCIQEAAEQVFWRTALLSQFNHQTALGTAESHHTWMHLHTQKLSVLQQPGLVQLERNHLLTTQHHTQQEVEASWFPHRAFSRNLKDGKLQITSLKQFYLPNGDSWHQSKQVPVGHYKVCLKQESAHSSGPLPPKPSVFRALAMPERHQLEKTKKQ